MLILTLNEAFSKRYKHKGTLENLQKLPCNVTEVEPSSCEEVTDSSSKENNKDEQERIYEIIKHLLYDADLDLELGRFTLAYEEYYAAEKLCREIGAEMKLLSLANYGCGRSKYKIGDSLKALEFLNISLALMNDNDVYALLKEVEAVASIDMLGAEQPDCIFSLYRLYTSIPMSNGFIPFSANNRLSNKGVPTFMTSLCQLEQHEPMQKEETWAASERGPSFSDYSSYCWADETTLTETMMTPTFSTSISLVNGDIGGRGLFFVKDVGDGWLDFYNIKLVIRLHSQVTFSTIQSFVLGETLATRTSTKNKKDGHWALKFLAYCNDGCDFNIGRDDIYGGGDAAISVY